MASHAKAIATLTEIRDVLQAMIDSSHICRDTISALVLSAQDGIDALQGANDDERVPFGTVVKLRRTEYKKLCGKYGKHTVDVKIEDMDIYCASKGKSYRDYYMALNGWLRRDARDAAAGKPSSVFVG